MYVKFKNENYGCWGSKRLVRRCPTHWHEFYEISFLLNGSAYETVNGIKRLASPGSVTLLSPDDFHLIEPLSDAPIEYEVCCIRAEELTGETAALLKKYPPPYYLEPKGQNLETLRAAFDLFIGELGNSGGRYTVKDTALASLSICVNIAAGGENLIVTDKSGEACGRLKSIRQVMQYISEHYPEKITRDEIAESCGFSPNYLSRLFKSVAGVSLSEHITDIRMQQAMSLFKNTDKCIGDIIESVGYRSPSLFYRHFYSRFGTKPSEARNGKPSHTL